MDYKILGFSQFATILDHPSLSFKNMQIKCSLIYMDRHFIQK